MKKLLLISIIALCNTVFAQYENYIHANVTDPRAWKWGQGKISQTNIEITPKGLFAEVSLFLTFAANKEYNTNSYSQFYDTDTVEYSLNFSLPKEANVIDSWLWIDNQTISKALLLERGIATAVYEGIVKRRKDPSIFYKNSSGYYELKVFPMIYDGERRVKISYLIPFKMQNSKLTLSLPSNFLSSSYSNSYYYNQSNINPDNFKIKVNADANCNSISYFKQTISGTTISNFASITLQPNVSTTINRLNTGENIFLQFDSPFVNGTFYSQYQIGNETFYQLGIVPNQLSGYPSSLTSSNLLLPDLDIITDVSNSLINFRQKQPTTFTNFKSQNMYAEFGIFNSNATQFKASAKFSINSNLIESQLTFSGNNTAITSDSMLRKQWAGLRISSLEKEYESNYYYYYYSTVYTDSNYIKNRNQVLFLSLKNRVLATNTSFLALEPAMTNPVCNNCVSVKNNTEFAYSTLNLVTSNGNNDNIPFILSSNNTVFVLSANDAISVTNFEIYPNPISTILNIKTGNDIEVSNIEIINLVGEIIFTKNVKNDFENTHILDISKETKSGIYLLRIYHKKGVFVQKIAIEN
ncbi:MAG: T9SS C-terminal target domain-containing protein [Bacteroidetes bacterium]|nr:MAG: T9SS C-terminal target domain-containing protein [Bacteroidota bacterium]